MEGTIDPAPVEPAWTDPATGKTHHNVFRLASVCDFPDDMEEGEEFYFQLNPSPNTACAVCQAYCPTPPEALAISITQSPCTND